MKNRFTSRLDHQVADDRLGITQEYNKENRSRLWDSAEARNQYKDEVFDGKQTYHDPISGKILHRNQVAAQHKYHMKNPDGQKISSKWSEHSAETDHINALKDVHNIVKHNPFLRDQDFKEVVNSKDNCRILSKKDNVLKKDKNDWQIILDKDSEISTQGKLQMAKEKIRADISIHSQFTARTVKNIGNELGKSGDRVKSEAVDSLEKLLAKLDEDTDETK